MAEVPYFFVAFSIVLGGLAAIAVWSRRRLIWRTAAVALLAAALPLGYLAHVELLSRPKPLALELRDLDQPQVIAAVLEEGEAIYLWLDVGNRPRYYALNWDAELAVELQDAMREAAEAGVGVASRLQEALRDEYESSVERRRPQRFFPLPMPAPPEKRRDVVTSPRFRM